MKFNVGMQGLALCVLIFCSEATAKNSDTLAWMKEINRFGKITQSVLKNLNEQMMKCTKKDELYKDLMDFYDKMVEKDEFEIVKSCVLKPNLVSQIKSMAKDPFFEEFMVSVYPKHKPVKRDDYIKHCTGMAK